MAANPNPTYITDSEWHLWEMSTTFIPGVRLGGIYANKSGYHNTVNANKVSWPGNYSIRLPLDLTEPSGKARALDLTMSDAEMTKRTGYLKAAALHPDDDRLGCMREFYGTLNGTTVYGLTHDSENAAWRSSTSDTSHLWHIHLSFFTKYCDDWDAAPGVYGLAGVASVLSGQTWESWVADGGGDFDMGITSKELNQLVLYPLVGYSYDGYPDVNSPDPYISNMAIHLQGHTVASVEQRLQEQINALKVQVEEICGKSGGNGGLVPHVHEVPGVAVVSGLAEEVDDN